MKTTEDFYFEMDEIPEDMYGDVRRSVIKAMREYAAQYAESFAGYAVKFLSYPPDIITHAQKFNIVFKNEKW